MTPNSLAAIPAALKDAGAMALLEAPIEQFLALKNPPGGVKGALQTAAMILEAVLSLHEEKRQLAASILDGADAAARLDGEDLLDLIRKGSLSSDDEDGGEDVSEVTGP